MSSAVGLSKPVIGRPKPARRNKSKRKPVKRVSSRGALIKQAHAIMRDVVIARDQHCVCPPPEKGHSDVLQAGHIIPSTKPGTRFDLWNVHVQCSGCNGRHVHFEHYYVDWFIEKFGSEQKLRLGVDAEHGHLKTYEIVELIEQLTAIREKQKKEPEWLPYFSQQEILSGKWREK